MIGGAELLLLAGIAAFYAYDAALMLFSEEVLFLAARRGWRASLGSGFMLGGRYLALPSLLVPGTPVLRASWGSGHPPDAEAVARIEAAVRCLRPLRWACRLVALLLFVAVPLALLRQWPPSQLLGLLLAIYATTLAGVLYLVRQRQALGLSRKALAAIALDVLACPPFAPNLVRRVSLRIPLAEPEAFARQVLPAEEEKVLAARVGQRIGLLADSDAS